MKKKISLVILSIVHSFVVDAQSLLTRVENNAFSTSEVLEYRIHYGFVDAGTAKLEVDPVLKNVGGRSCYRVVGSGKSTGAFNWFFKVRDHYESYIDTEAIVPWLFIRDIQEGGYKKKQNVKFNHSKNIATSEKKSIKTPERIQDLISAFYFARTLDFTNIAVGDTFNINCYLDDETFPMAIKFVGREKIKTRLGTFRCLMFRPYLLEGRVFKEKEGMTIWLTDDKNRIPIRAQAEILVGSIKMDITSFSGLANPVALSK
ncbi:MAG: DUF3108 domain-containing protein [Bacteroidetes bacterium]|nr:DUF3108 domain-containing protein [Bacteroidota bacterium]